MTSPAPARRKPWPLALILKASVLLTALIGVIFLVQAVRSPGFEAALARMFATDPVWNWCPATVERIVLVGSDVAIEDSTQIGRLCSVTMESLQSDDVQGARFEPVLIAIAGDETQTTVDGDLDRGVFRVGGLPFRSEGLRAALRDDGRP